MPSRRTTGSSSPRPGTSGWMRLRVAAVTTSRRPRGSSSGWARRRRIAIRRPTVSARGESRSCGRVSQLGSKATTSRPSRSPVAVASSSASRSVAVTARTVRPWARPAARKGRSAAGPSTASAGTPAARTSRAAAASAPSSGSEVVSRPESLATIPLAAGTQDRPLPGTGGGLPPGYAARRRRVGTPVGTVTGRKHGERAGATRPSFTVRDSRTGEARLGFRSPDSDHGRPGPRDADGRSRDRPTAGQKPGRQLVVPAALRRHPT